MSKSYIDIYMLNNETIHYMLDVDEAFKKLIAAIRASDDNKLGQIIDYDAEFNRRRDALETKCLKLFLKEQHYSRDLRNLLSVFKITTEVERIADQIRDVAENFIGRSVDASDIFKAFIDMLERCRAMFNSAVKCFGSFDDEMSQLVKEADDDIDKAYVNIKQLIQNAMKIEVKDVFFSLLSAIKHTEKIGDHAVNIAEWVHYTVSGERKIRKPVENRG